MLLIVLSSCSSGKQGKNEDGFPWEDYVEGEDYGEPISLEQAKAELSDIKGRLSQYLGKDLKAADLPYWRQTSTERSQEYWFRGETSYSIPDSFLLSSTTEWGTHITVLPDEDGNFTGTIANGYVTYESSVHETYCFKDGRKLVTVWKQEDSALVYKDKDGNVVYQAPPSNSESANTGNYDKQLFLDTAIAQYDTSVAACFDIVALAEEALMALPEDGEGVSLYGNGKGNFLLYVDASALPSSIEGLPKGDFAYSFDSYMPRMLYSTTSPYGEEVDYESCTLWDFSKFSPKRPSYTLD